MTYPTRMVVIDPGLPRHPKVLRLAAKLEFCAPAIAVGILVCLWDFAREFGPDGNLFFATDDDIARAIGWVDQRAELIAALVETGWLERTPTGLRIHDAQHHFPWLRRKATTRQRTLAGIPAKPPLSELALTETPRAYAHAHGVEDPERALEDCRDWHAARGKQWTDGAAIFRMWIRKDADFRRRDTPTGRYQLLETPTTMAEPRRAPLP